MIMAKLPEHIPFVEVTRCEKCGNDKLEKVHDQTYPDQDGFYRLVIYRCTNGHETRTRQLVVRQFNVPPKANWEGYV